MNHHLLGAPHLQRSRYGWNRYFGLLGVNISPVCNTQCGAVAEQTLKHLPVPIHSGEPTCTGPSLMAKGPHSHSWLCGPKMCRLTDSLSIGGWGGADLVVHSFPHHGVVHWGQSQLVNLHLGLVEAESWHSAETRHLRQHLLRGLRIGRYERDIIHKDKTMHRRQAAAGGTPSVYIVSHNSWWGLLGHSLAMSSRTM